MTTWGQQISDTKSWEKKPRVLNYIVIFPKHYIYYAIQYCRKRDNCFSNKKWTLKQIQKYTIQVDEWLVSHKHSIHSVAVAVDLSQNQVNPTT